MRRTSDGGFTWTNITIEQYASIQMYDSLIGWKGFDDIKKTTDGGLTWNNQQTPNFYRNEYFGISILNKDSVWFAGPKTHVADKYRGILLKTTNGGLQWGFQYPDTTSNYSQFYYIKFIDNKKGWAWPYFLGGTLYDAEIHTKVGGSDTTFITSVSPQFETISGYSLSQNYPNPFNQMTNIKYQITNKSFIILKIFDITGKEITTLLNEEKQTGIYSIRFDAGNLSSGVYFYQMSVNGKAVDVKKMIYVR